MTLQHQCISSIHSVAKEDWNKLNISDNPFLKYQFLAALETHQCVGKESGWLPQHLLIWSEKTLVAVMPGYLKFNSYGEFVFDWSWANFYEQHGQEYYPKLIFAIPFSPVTGNRLLISNNLPSFTNIEEIFKFAGTCIRDYVKTHHLSSAHILFSKPEEAKNFNDHGFLLRTDCQFHWHNKNYIDFDDYLSTFTSKKRRNIKRERRIVAEQNFTFIIATGDKISDDEWKSIHSLYASTFQRLGGHASLSYSFFLEISKTMPDNILVIQVVKNDTIIAAAICLKDDKTLYGRHWGALQHFDQLHFETCYYQGLEYCIKHKLQNFEPGAQGEHKISRGFVPVITQSTHWIPNAEFRQVISNFLTHETEALKDYSHQLEDHLPFK